MIISFSCKKLELLVTIAELAWEAGQTWDLDIILKTAPV